MKSFNVTGLLLLLTKLKWALVKRQTKTKKKKNQLMNVTSYVTLKGTRIPVISTTDTLVTVGFGATSNIFVTQNCSGVRCGRIGKWKFNSRRAADFHYQNGNCRVCWTGNLLCVNHVLEEITVSKNKHLWL